jgi:hypothetical protein
MYTLTTYSICITVRKTRKTQWKYYSDGYYGYNVYCWNNLLVLCLDRYLFKIKGGFGDANFSQANT